MALPNDSILKAPDGSGALVSTELVSGKEYEVDMKAGDAGHLFGTRDSYLVLAVPSVSGVAGQVWFDIFNGVGSGKTLEIHGIWFNSNLDLAAAATVAYKLNFFRTSTSGSGGNLYASATLPRSVSRINAVVGSLPAQVTMRDRPTGGAATSLFIGQSFYFSEETSTSFSYTTQFFNALRYAQYEDMADLKIPSGTGLKIEQGTVTTLGLLGYRVAFSIY
jgi:hypothetical protein